MSSIYSVEYDSTVNQYFEVSSALLRFLLPHSIAHEKAHAAFSSPLIHVSGASRIKLLVRAMALLSSSSALIGSPTYDSKTQVASFAFRRMIQLPWMRTGRSVAWDVTLRMMADEDGEGQPGASGRKFYVTKVEVLRQGVTAVETYM